MLQRSSANRFTGWVWYTLGGPLCGTEFRERILFRTRIGMQSMSMEAIGYTPNVN